MTGGSFLAPAVPVPPTDVPHFPQNFAFSDNGFPQCGQCIIPTSLDRSFSRQASKKEDVSFVNELLCFSEPAQKG
jgi:hypothetical protein